MNQNHEIGSAVGEKGTIVGGYARGNEIWLPNTDGSATAFMKAFHEVGHIVDTQFDIKEAIRPSSELQQATITFTPEERAWLLDQSSRGWPESGYTAVHKDIVERIFKVILKPKIRPHYAIHSVTQEELDEIVKKYGVAASTIVDGKIEISDHREHRNLEFPADYMVEVCFDIFNRSINKEFALPHSTRIFAYAPDERNQRTDKIAQYVLKKGWIAPGHIFGLSKRK